MASRHRLSRHTFPKNNTGIRVTGPHFSLTWGFVPSDGGCAVVISKKTARRSVDRHLLKRRVLEALAPFAARDRYIVIYARAGAATLSFHAIQGEIQTLLMKTKLSVAQ